MKKHCIILLILCLFALPVRADIASGILEFVYGVLYFSIGTTPCKDIVEKEGGKEGAMRQMRQIVDTANNIAGKDTVDIRMIEYHFGELYEYCEHHPQDLFGQALLIVLRPMFSDMTHDLNDQVRQNSRSPIMSNEIPPVSNQDNRSTHNHSRVTGDTGATTESDGVEFIN